MEGEKLFKRLKEWTQTSHESLSQWRDRARLEYKFYTGDQWTDDEKAALKDMALVPLVINRTAPIINSVVGTEISNRTEIQYLRREEGDQTKSDMFTGAGEWFRDEAHAEEHETDAFRDSLICGIGFTDTWLDFDEDSEGKPKIRRFNPLEAFWDQHAEQTNIEDARFVGRVRNVDIEDAKDFFPDAKESDLHAEWLMNSREDHGDDEDDGGDYGENVKRQRVDIVQIDWKEREKYIITVDPQTGEETEVKKRMVEALKEAGAPYAELTRWVYKRAFLGARNILWRGDAPIQGEFSIQAVTAYRDPVKRDFYGMVRGLIDPQKLANKSLQQVLRLIDTSAKGGLMVEKEALGDRADEIAESWAANDEITVFEDGSLTKGKVQPKPQTPLNSAYLTLFEVASNAKQMVSGVSSEMMGLRETTQAASLEYQRRQATMTILAPLFDNLRFYRKRQGKVTLYLIQNDLSDGRLIRILGEAGEPKYIPLIREDDSLEYDIILEESPVSPNQKERIWSYIQGLLQTLGPLPPAAMASLLKYSPLPAKLAHEIGQSLIPQQGDPQQQQAQQQAQQIAQQAALLEMKDKAAETAETLTKADLNEAKTQQIQEELEATRRAAGVQRVQQELEAGLALGML